jgi:hypothetical protein
MFSAEVHRQRFVIIGPWTALVASQANAALESSLTIFGGAVRARTYARHRMATSRSNGSGYLVVPTKATIVAFALAWFWLTFHPLSTFRKSVRCC